MSVVRCSVLAAGALAFSAAMLVAQQSDSTKAPVKLAAKHVAKPGDRREPPPPPLLSPEAQAALDDLAPRFASDVEQIQGWFREKPVLYFNFGEVAKPITVGNVYWPIYGFDANGHPVALRGQRPIFETIPKLAGYSGIWRLTYVVTADHVQPNDLRDTMAVHALVRRKRASLRDANVTLNLPIVARGSRLANDSTAGALGWFTGRDVQYFDFGQVGAVPVAMWRFAIRENVDGQPKVLTSQNSIVDSVPRAGAYPDLWEIRFVRVDTPTYSPNSLKDGAALLRANLSVDAPSSIRNLPITMLDGAKLPRVPSPLTLFADNRSPMPPALTKTP